MSESLERTSAQQPVSSRTSRSAACSWVSLFSTCPLGSDQTRGSPRPISRASKEFPFRRKTSPPAETSYLIRIIASGDSASPNGFGLVFFSIARRPKKDRPPESQPLLRRRARQTVPGQPGSQVDRARSRVGDGDRRGARAGQAGRRRQARIRSRAAVIGRPQRPETGGAAALHRDERQRLDRQGANRWRAVSWELRHPNGGERAGPRGPARRRFEAVGAARLPGGGQDDEYNAPGDPRRARSGERELVPDPVADRAVP